MDPPPAIESMEGLIGLDEIGIAAPVSPADKGEDPTAGRKLFVGGLSWDTDSKMMSEYFNRFGELEDAMVVYNRQAGVSRGFGFVTFKAKESADSCLTSTMHKINNKMVETKRAVQKGEQGRIAETLEQKMAKQVFIGGLPQNTTSDELKEWAQAQWTPENITNAIAVLDLETKVTRGFGFVNFTDPSMVAIATQPGREYFIGEKKVEVKRAQMRERNHYGGGGGGRGYGGGRGGRGRGRGGRGGHRGQSQSGYGYPNQGYGYPQQYGGQMPGYGQYDMSAYQQYGAPGYMQYGGQAGGQVPAGQAAYNPQQMQAMYNGMGGAYSQAPPPALGPRSTPPQGKGLQQAPAPGGAPEGYASGVDGMDQYFKQMNLSEMPGPGAPGGMPAGALPTPGMAYQQQVPEAYSRAYGAMGGGAPMGGAPPMK